MADDGNPSTSLIATLHTDAIDRSTAAEIETIAEITAMFRYAMSSGYGPLADHVIRTLDQLNDDGPPPPLADLVECHRKLTEVVAPATPRGLRIMVPSDNSRSGRLKMPPVATRLMLVAGISLMVMLGFALSPEVNEQGGSLFDDHGIGLLYILVFLFAASTLGASFHGLFTLSNYLVEATYDPKFDPSYWIRLVLGILSGMMLSTLEIASLNGESRSVLALAGGFSTMLVYRIFQRVVSTIESLVSPPAAPQAAPRVAPRAAPQDPTQATPQTASPDPPRAAPREPPLPMDADEDEDEPAPKTVRPADTAHEQPSANDPVSARP